MSDASEQINGWTDHLFLRKFQRLWILSSVMPAYCMVIILLKIITKNDYQHNIRRIVPFATHNFTFAGKQNKKRQHFFPGRMQRAALGAISKHSTEKCQHLFCCWTNKYVNVEFIRWLQSTWTKELKRIFMAKQHNESEKAQMVIF